MQGPVPANRPVQLCPWLGPHRPPPPPHTPTEEKVGWGGCPPSLPTTTAQKPREERPPYWGARRPLSPWEFRGGRLITHTPKYRPGPKTLGRWGGKAPRPLASSGGGRREGRGGWCGGEPRPALRALATPAPHALGPDARGSQWLG